MYPRNAASPERLAIGAVVQISDGAVQTSGVSVKVMPQGGAASAGGGTIAYEEGIVHYLPTQAETNYTSFMLIAYKTGCIPVSTTVVTTASTTPGTVLLAPTTHTSAVVPTVTTLTGHTAQTGDAFARLGAPVGASISADVAAVKTQTAAIEVDTQDIQSRLPAALVSGRIDASVGAMASGVLTATAIAADAITDAKVASDVTIASVTGSVGSVTGAVGSVTGNVGGNVTGSVGSVATGGITSASFASGAITATAIAADAIGASELAADAIAEIADAVWDEAISGHLTGGTTGAALNGATAPTAAAVADAVWDEILSGHVISGSAGEALTASGGAGDPWITALPGAYSAGQAGYILGNNLNATVSSRATQTSVDTVDDFLDTEIGAIKAKTDSLPASPAASGDCITAAGVRTAVGLASANLDTQLADLPTNAELSTALAAADDAVLAAVADKTGYRLSATGVNDILRTALTEGYAADGATFTLEQALYMLWALLAERSLSGTTLTAKKLDGSTTAMSFTLDDGTTPTSQTRSS